METQDSSDSNRLPRRTVLQWFGASAALASGGISVPALSQGAKPAGAEGYGTDPDLTRTYEPGDVWPLTFSDDQKRTVIALVDTILPGDEFGPPASELRVPDYIDEWISAPYPNQRRDREVILPGLVRFEEAVRRETGKDFAGWNNDRRERFCDSIVREDRHPLGGFFDRFTMIAAGAYFSTPEGWKAIGYSGNLATPTFAGPPQEVLDRVGVQQTVA